MQHETFKTQKETFTYFNKLIKKENVHLFPFVEKKVIGTVSISLLNDYRNDWILRFANHQNIGGYLLYNHISSNWYLFY